MRSPHEIEQLHAEAAALRCRLREVESALGDARLASPHEEALRAAHDSFRHLVEQSPFGIYAVDADFRLVLVSAGAQRVFAGVRPLIGRDFAEVLRAIWPEPFASEAIAVFRAVLATGAPYHAPSTVERRRDIDAVESYDWKVERVVLPDGRPGAVCHFYDLSERQRYEAALREREQQLRFVTDHAEVMIVHCDAEVRYRFANAPYCRRIGRRPEEIVGQRVRDVVGAAAYESVRARVEAALRGERVAFTEEVPYETGTRWMHAVYVPQRDEAGEVVGFVAVVQDITARKAIERGLELAAERAEVAQRAAGAFFYEFRPRSDEALRSPTMRMVLGYAPDEVGPSLAGWRALIHPDDVARLDQGLDEGLREGPGYSLEYRVRHRDGRYLTVSDQARVVRGEGGVVDRVVGVVIDVTDRRRADDALRDADRRKDEFLATLAHELRNPLAPLANAVALLRAPRADEAAAALARDTLARQVRHMARLVDDLLDVSRVSRGEITLRREPLDLALVAQQAVEAARPEVDRRRHALAVSVEGEGLVVDGDETRLAQVITNLLTNAAKFTPPGGAISLSLARERGPRGPEVALRVRDNGRGLSPGEAPRLFELFYQSEREIDRAEGGLGIGLSLVKRLVELHGGRVEVRSEGPGRGSEFTVRLAELTGAASSSRPPAAEVEATSPGLRVLVVDDNEDSAETMAALLALDGHRATLAHDGRRAVALALAERPDVVLLDIGLPGLDGYAACRAMREGGLSDALIVAMTGYGQERDRQRSLASGFDGHEVKPVPLASLQAMLARRAAAPR